MGSAHGAQGQPRRGLAQGLLVLVEHGRLVVEGVALLQAHVPAPLPRALRVLRVHERLRRGRLVVEVRDLRESELGEN